jgi:lipopolysaccharide assembly outer membrane protein LptD (OstA)
LKTLINAAALSILFFTCVSFAAQGKQTVITGDEMEVLKGGDITVSKGNSKAVNGDNTVTADKMTYDKKKSLVSASGRVKLYSKSSDGSPVEASGDYAKYNLGASAGELFGKKADLKYGVKNSDSPLVLKAGEIRINAKNETLSARGEVEIITSSGTIYSDNAVFDKKSSSLLAVKELKRPAADVIYDGRKGFYEADEMVFYNSADNKKIVMSGSVKGKMHMEDKIK